MQCDVQWHDASYNKLIDEASSSDSLTFFDKVNAWLFSIELDKIVLTPLHDVEQIGDEVVIVDCNLLLLLGCPDKMKKQEYHHLQSWRHEFW